MIGPWFKKREQWFKTMSKMVQKRGLWLKKKKVVQRKRTVVQKRGWWVKKRTVVQNNEDGVSTPN